MSAAYTCDIGTRGAAVATYAVAASALAQTIATNGSARAISPDEERTSARSKTPRHGRGESFVKSLAGWLKGREVGQLLNESCRAASCAAPVGAEENRPQKQPWNCK